MLFKRWLWYRRGPLALFALFGGVFAVTFALYHLPLAAVGYPFLLCAALGTVVLIGDFLHTRAKHRQLARIAAQLEALPAQLPAAASVAEEDCQYIIEALQRQLAKLESGAAARTREMEDYYTAWAHQIKTPIAAMRLTLQNEDSPLARRLTADLFRIEQYVEMVLTFLRLDSPSSDYVFRDHALDDILTGAVKKFAPSFIDRRLRLDYAPTGVRLVTDEKWLSFVVEQLLSNALKYTPEGGGVRIYLEEPKTLCIADTGIGIAPQDLPRVFEKGYTGANGRREGHASGLGLYLCRRVCDNLGVGIALTSAPGEGTVARLDLAQYDLKAE